LKKSFMNTTTNLLTKLHNYATSRGLNFELEEMSAPPPVLQGLIVASGICLTIREPEPTGEPPAQLGVWLSTSSSEVTCCMMREYDDVIETTSHTIPEDEERMAFVAYQCRRFYRDLVFAPALEVWSDEKGIGYEVIKPTEFYAEAAMWGDCHEWFFVKFNSPNPEEEDDLIIGISGDERTATFLPGEEGFLGSDEWLPKLKSGPDLIAWLEKTLARRQNL
jgi:hypothetical protein